MIPSLERRTPSPLVPTLRMADVGPERAQVLLADDEAEILRLNADALRRAGYPVTAVGDGEAAWQQLQEQSFRLLITDHLMPRLSGLQLIQRIRAARLPIPIVLASGSFSRVPLDDLPWVECRALLAKPYSPEQLIVIVEEVLAGAGCTRSATKHFCFQNEPHFAWGINE